MSRSRRNGVRRRSRGRRGRARAAADTLSTRALPVPSGWTFVRSLQAGTLEVYENNGVTMNLSPTTGTVVLMYKDSESGRQQQRVYRKCTSPVFRSLCASRGDFQQARASQASPAAAERPVATVCVQPCASGNELASALGISKFERRFIPSTLNAKGIGLSFGVALGAMSRVNARLANWVLNGAHDTIPLVAELTADLPSHVGRLLFKSAKLLSLGSYSKALGRLASTSDAAGHAHARRQDFATLTRSPLVSCSSANLQRQGNRFQFELTLNALPLGRSHTTLRGEALVVCLEVQERECQQGQQGATHKLFAVVNLRATPQQAGEAVARLLPTAPYERPQPEHFDRPERAAACDYVAVADDGCACVPRLRHQLHEPARSRKPCDPPAASILLHSLGEHEKAARVAIQRTTRAELSPTLRQASTNTQLLLRWRAAIEAMKRFDALNVAILPLGSHRFRCTIEGLTESRLGVVVGNACIVRVRPAGGAERALEAIVAHVERDTIVFNASKLDNGTRTVCIRFLCNPFPFCAQLAALECHGRRVESMLREKTKWSAAHLAERPELERPELELLELLSHLDPSQEKAARAVAMDDGTERLQLVFGPPGTGKSHVLIAALCVLVARGARVLVCAPSNDAVDLIITRFLETLKSSPKKFGIRDLAEKGPLLRVQAKGRSPSFVRAEVLGISTEQQGRGFARPTGVEVLQAEVVFTTCVSACVLPAAGNAASDKNGFDAILIDEAGNTCETESLIPLSLATRSRTTRLALFGDWNQLRPVVIGHETITNKAPLLTSALGAKADSERSALAAPCAPDRDDDDDDDGPALFSLSSRSTSTSAAASASSRAPQALSTTSMETDDPTSLELVGFDHWVGVNPCVSLLERRHFEAKRDTSESEIQHQLSLSYRMDPGVCTTVSTMFYEGDLHPSRRYNTPGRLYLQKLQFEPLQRLPAWESVRRGRQDQKTRMFFLDVEGEEMREKGSPSWFNVAEVLLTCSIVRALSDSVQLERARTVESRSSSDEFKPVSVAVLSPYRKQATKIRSQLNRLPGVHLSQSRTRRLDSASSPAQHAEPELDASSAAADMSITVNVGSAELLQGQEADVVVVSTVRSSPEHFVDDKRNSLGFVADKKRLNVAISRARYLVVVVGHRRTLQIDPTWRQFTDSCETNGALGGS